MGDAQKECKRRGLNAGGKKEEMKKRLLIDNNTICLEDENENSEIENGTAYDTYPSGTALLTKLRKSIETSAGFLAPQKILLSKGEKKLSLHQTEQVESKLKEETKNPLESKEIVTKDEKLEEKSIDQLKGNNDLTNDDISILSHRDAQKECKRRGLNAGGKKEEMKKRLLIDNNTIFIEDENENSEIENDTAYDTYPSGTSLLIKLRKSIETSVGFLAPQKILLSKGEKKLSLHQTEQVESKLKEETKNPLESKEIVTKDKKLEEKSIDQLKANNDLTNDDISILSYRDAQKECKRRGLNAGGKKEEIKKRLLLDNDANIPESICLSPSALATMSAVTPFSSIERTQQIETQLQQDANYNHLSPVKEGEVEDLESYKKRKRDKSQTKVDLPITNKRRRGRKENTRVSKR